MQVLTTSAVRGARPRIASLLGVWMLFGISPTAFAQVIDVRPAVHVEMRPEGIRIAGRLYNASDVPATGLRLHLWPLQQSSWEITTQLSPGETIERAWLLTPDLWRRVHREVAAVRVDYQDASGRGVSRVAAAGRAAEIDVDPPRWSAVQLDFVMRARVPPTSPVSVEWWTPTQLGIVSPDRWERAAPELGARLSPSSQIDGWRAQAVAILLPEDAQSASVVMVPIDATTAAPLWQPPRDALTLWFACIVGGVVGMLRARRFRLGWLPGIVFLALAGGAALALAPPALVTLPTTPGGGDYGSQYVTLDYLGRELLPRGALYGWFPGHFAGLPLFLMYFPLVFWLAAALSVAMPAPMALKLASLSGPLLLPVAWFVVLRWLTGSRSAPWLGAAAAVIFLLNERQQVWGGNLASVLAGEFAQGLGFPLAWITVAWAWSRVTATLDTTRGALGAGVLLALTTLAHAYAGVAAAIGIALLVWHRDDWWRRSVFVTITAATSAGLLAWWLLPLFWSLPWTTGSRERWPAPLSDIFPMTTWPLVAAAVVAVARVAFEVLRRRGVSDPHVALLALYALAMGLTAELGYSVGLVNIRFLPMCLGAVLLLGASEGGRALDALTARPRAVVLSAVLVSLLAGALWPIRYLPMWTRWNMQGIELAPGWRDYQRLIANLQTMGARRVFYEHNIEHDRLGTPRAFELLPVLAGAATLEGLYLQSALLAPAVLTLQAELSVSPSCAVTAFECARFDVDTGVQHARMLGADTIVAYSRRLTDALDAHPAVSRGERAGPYVTYRIHDASLAVPVQHMPVNIPREGWRYSAHDWYRAARDHDVPLVASGAADGRAFVDRYHPGGLARVPLAAVPAVSVEDGGHRLRVRTDTPGHPVIVRVAYHPGWRADDGSLIEVAAPGLLLVTPRSREVTLTWSSGAVGWLGVGLSCLTGLLLAWHLARRRECPLSELAKGERASSQEAAWQRRWAPFVLTPVGILLLITGVWLWWRFPPIDAGVRLGEGQQRLAMKDFTGATAAFRDVRRGQQPMHDDADFYLALVVAEAGQHQEARASWIRFLDAHPVSTYTAETLVRLGRLDATDGAHAAARTRFAAALNAPLAPPEWIDAARAELLALPR